MPKSTGVPRTTFLASLKDNFKTLAKFCITFIFVKYSLHLNVITLILNTG